MRTRPHQENLRCEPRTIQYDLVPGQDHGAPNNALTKRAGGSHQLAEMETLEWVLGHRQRRQAGRTEPGLKIGELHEKRSHLYLSKNDDCVVHDTKPLFQCTLCDLVWHSIRHRFKLRDRPRFCQP